MTTDGGAFERDKVALQAEIVRLTAENARLSRILDLRPGQTDPAAEQPTFDATASSWRPERITAGHTNESATEPKVRQSGTAAVWIWAGGRRGGFGPPVPV